MSYDSLVYVLWSYSHSEGTYLTTEHFIYINYVLSPWYFPVSALSSQDIAVSTTLKVLCFSVWSATGMEGTVSLEYIAQTLCPPPSSSLPATNVDPISQSLHIARGSRNWDFSCNLFILKQRAQYFKRTDKQTKLLCSVKENRFAGSAWCVTSV